MESKKNKYEVTLLPYTSEEKIYKFEAKDREDALKQAYKEAKTKDDPKHRSCYIVARIDK
jgi:hypothetical protein